MVPRPMRRLASPGDNRRHVNALDGLRCLCILGILGYQLQTGFLGGGLVGVTVLFVLTGYLITSSLMREFSMTKGSIDLRAFWSRRLWRVMPLVVVLVCVMGAVCALANHVLFAQMQPDIFPGLLMVLNWTKIFSGASYFVGGDIPSPLSHLWALAVEMQFYLIWPPMLYVLMGKRIRRKNVKYGLLAASLVSAVLMAVLYVPGADPTRVFLGTDTRAVSLFLGSWLAIAWPLDRMARRKVSRLRGHRRLIVNVGGPVALIGLLALMVLSESYSAFSYYGGIVLASVLAALAIAALVPEDGIAARVLSLPPLVWAGRRAFSLFIWHYPIHLLMNPLNETGTAPILRVVGELVLTVLVAAASYRLIEYPLRTSDTAQMPFGAATYLPLQGEERRRPRVGMPLAVAEIPSYVPAFAVGSVALAIMTFGIMSVEPEVIVSETSTTEKVMQASLKKPLQGGVYDVVLIGDSVALGASDELNEAFPHGLIDARNGRQMTEALKQLTSFLDEGVVGNDVVMSIGTSCVLSKNQLEEALLDVGDERDLWLVNIRSPYEKDERNNALIDAFAAAHENVKVIDWNQESLDHSEWLADDGVTLTSQGKRAFVDTIVDVMGYKPPTDVHLTYDVVIVGDTLLLDAADDLAELYPGGLIDAAGGRSLSDLIDVYTGYADQGFVGNAVVLVVGNEEPLTQEDLDSFVNAASFGRRVYLVNVRTAQSWQKANNDLIKRTANSRSEVFLIDWYAESEGEPDWVGADGTHLTEEGAKAYADLIKHEVDTSIYTKVTSAYANRPSTLGTTNEEDGTIGSTTEEDDTYGTTGTTSTNGGTTGTGNSSTSTYGTNRTSDDEDDDYGESTYDGSGYGTDTDTDETDYTTEDDTY